MHVGVIIGSILIITPAQEKMDSAKVGAQTQTIILLQFKIKSPYQSINKLAERTPS